jgi:hypothetical protein
MKRMILVCWLCLAATSVYAEEHWIADKETGCQLLFSGALPSDNSVSWSGACKDGKVNGKGKLKFYEKKKMTGTFDGTAKNGELIYGTTETIDGRKYVGEFKNGNINGNGKMTWPEGKVYIGEWKDGTQHGTGTMTFPPVSKIYIEYTGEWENNDPHGTGTMTYKTGDKYSGSWLKGRPHGKGTYTFKDGTSYEGLWEHGERIKIF